MQQLQSLLAVTVLRLAFASVSLIADLSRWLRERGQSWATSEA